MLLEGGLYKVLRIALSGSAAARGVALADRQDDREGLRSDEEEKSRTDRSRNLQCGWGARDIHGCPEDRRNRELQLPRLRQEKKMLPLIRRPNAESAFTTENC